MQDEAGLIEKLRKIEALFARPGTEGERAAAQNARDRILERLQQIERVEPAVEYRFALLDPWSHALFTAMARRYGLTPYRRRGQRRTSVMLKVTRTFLNEILWPEFRQADETLRAHLNEVTQRVIAEAISRDTADIEERAAAGPAKPGPRPVPWG